MKDFFSQIFLMILIFQFNIFVTLAHENPKEEDYYGQVFLLNGQATKWVEERNVSIAEKTKVRKGDLIETHKDSNLWIVLKNGLLIRLWPKSKLVIREVVQSPQKIFYFLRLIDGLANIIDYKKINTLKPLELSDSLFRNSLNLRKDEMMDGSNTTNEEIKEVLLITGNLSIQATNPDFLIASPMGSASEFMIKESDHFQIQCRNLLEDSTMEIQKNIWYKTDFLGTTLDESSGLKLMDLYTKRLAPIKYKITTLFTEMDQKKTSFQVSFMKSEEMLDLHIRFLKAFSRKNERIYLESLNELITKEPHKFNLDPAVLKEEYFRMAKKSFNYQLQILE